MSPSHIPGTGRGTARRRVHATIGVAVLVAALGGGSHAALAQDPETITVWTQWNQAEADEVKKVAQEFEAANPGVTVTVETRATDPHKEALRVSLNTDAAPDVFQMWGGVGLGGFYVGSGGVEPLTDTYTALGWQDRFLPNAVALSTFDGTVYGAPDNIHGMGLYYRKDLFDKAGITAVPTTYDELVAANQKLVAAGITPLSGAGKFGWMTMRLIDSLLELKCGADVHDQLVARTASWDQACVTEAFTELHRWVSEKWITDGFMALDPGAGEHLPPVYAGQAAMVYDGDWLVSQLTTAGQDLSTWDFFPFPTDTQRLSSFGEMLMISKTSQHKDLAAKFVDYFTSPEIQSEHAGKLNTLISPTKAATPPADMSDLAKKWITTMGDYDAIYLPTDQALSADLVTKYFEVTDGVALGSVDPATAGATMQGYIDQAAP